jgi:N-acetylglucosaminyldiphosphoundecaprenol N-acetyl-beta-D-mannosaminyltransferase
LLLTRVVPLAIFTQWYRLKSDNRASDLLIHTDRNDQSIMLRLSGVATERHIQKAVSCFREASTGTQSVIIDLSDIRLIDARFFGLLLMLRKQIKGRGAKLIFTGVSPTIGRLFRLNELGFLLSADQNHRTCATF